MERDDATLFRQLATAQPWQQNFTAADIVAGFEIPLLARVRNITKSIANERSWHLTTFVCQGPAQ